VYLFNFIFLEDADDAIAEPPQTVETEVASKPTTKGKSTRAQRWKGMFCYCFQVIWSSFRESSSQLLFV
jgi:hypothetical protein